MSDVPFRASRALEVLPLGLGALYLVAAPSFDVLAASDYDEKRILQAGLLLVNVGCLLASSHLRRAWLQCWRRMPRGVRALLALALVGGALSATVAAVPRAGLLEVSHYVLLAALAVTVAATVRERPLGASRVLAGAAVTGVAIYFTSFAANAAAAWTATGAPPPIKEAFPNFLHFRFVGQWQSWTLPLVVGAAAALLPGSARLASVAIAVLAAAWWALLFVAGARGALLGQAIATVAVALWLGARSRPWLERQIRAALYGLVLYLLCYVTLARDLGAFAKGFVHVASASSSGRMDLWREAVAMVAERPLLGFGPQHFVARAEVVSAHPHNAVLQWAAEWGLPAAAAIVGVLAWGLLGWSRRLRSEPAALDPPATGGGIVPVALTASLVAGLVHAMTSGIVVMPLAQTWMVVVVGWALGLHQMRQSTALVYRPAAMPTLIAALVTFAVVFVISIAPEPGNGRLRYDRGDPAAATERFRPRFWQRGEIGTLDVSSLDYS